MDMQRRQCVNSPDVFCYICGKFTIKSQRRSITSFVQQAYHAYFKMQLGDQDKPWAPQIVCMSCNSILNSWFHSKTEHFSFGIPMVWREPKDHTTDCYFCLVKVAGATRKTKKSINYVDLDSARLPVAHSTEFPVPVPELKDTSSSSTEATATSSGSDIEKKQVTPGPLNQYELNDLVRDLALSKAGAELLASRLSEKELTQPSLRISYYRSRDREFLRFFSSDSDFV